MKIGKYTIKFSELGKHYIELLGGLLCIAVMIISLSAVSVWIISSGHNTLQVTHVYEDNCIDLYNTEKQTYQFYCEDMTFYEE